MFQRLTLAMDGKWTKENYSMKESLLGARDLVCGPKSTDRGLRGSDASSGLSATSLPGGYS